MAPVSKVLFLVVVVVVAMAVLSPPSPVHGGDPSTYCKYAYDPTVFLTDILDVYMIDH
jgi:hypothetical protein